MSRPPEDALHLAVAAYGLPGAEPVFPTAPLPEASWNALCAAVRRHRLCGLLAAAVGAGALPATSSQWDDVAELHGQALAVAVVLDRLLVELSRVLEDADIPHRALKGSAVAHTCYPDPSWRQYGDIDLLVPSDPYDRALKVLAEAGCHRIWPQLRAGFDRTYGKGTTLRNRDGQWVDIHRTLVMGPFGLTLQPDDLFSGSSVFVVAGHPLRALDPDLQFLHACYNAALADVPPRLVALRDVAQLTLNAELNWERVLAFATAWEGRAVVARAVRIAWERFGIADRVLISEWAVKYQPSRSEERALSHHLDSGRRFARKAFASVSKIRGLRAKLGYVSALAMPDRAFLDHRDTGTVTWWRRGSASFRGGPR